MFGWFTKTTTTYGIPQMTKHAPVPEVKPPKDSEEIKAFSLPDGFKIPNNIPTMEESMFPSKDSPAWGARFTLPEGFFSHKVYSFSFPVFSEYSVTDKPCMGIRITIDAPKYDTDKIDGKYCVYHNKKTNKRNKK